jgi:uncharacterized lipoprotein YehR (DUF1307 family)
MKIELNTLQNQKTNAEKTLDYIEFIQQKQKSLSYYVRYYPDHEKILEKNNEFFNVVKGHFERINYTEKESSEKEINKGLKLLEKIYADY